MGAACSAPSNWNGRAYRISRSELAALAGRADAAHAGRILSVGRATKTRIPSTPARRSACDPAQAAPSERRGLERAHRRHQQGQSAQQGACEVSGAAVLQTGRGGGPGGRAQWQRAARASSRNTTRPCWRSSSATRSCRHRAGPQDLRQRRGERDAPQRPRSAALRKGRAIPKLTWRGPSAETEDAARIERVRTEPRGSMRALCTDRGGDPRGGSDCASAPPRAVFSGRSSRHPRRMSAHVGA